MAVREDQKIQVQQSTDIVDLIGEQILLKQKGREFLALCPFHDDNNPSMHVSPSKQIYKCFSCGAGGDVFSWMMNYHKMTFPEALKHLAERAHITLEFSSGGGRAGGDEQAREAASGERELIATANENALRFFQHMFHKSPQGTGGEVARQYVARRGISDEMIEAFGIGYAPDGWDALVNAIEQKRWNRAGFEAAGLISARQQGTGGGGFYDRLRHRIIFPIRDALGRPIAFGGRKIREEDEPKYLNSPETALFNKSATLYGLDLAKKAMMDSRTAVIVEGYTDVIACHQGGAANVVATLGTALTQRHVKMLRRFAERVVLVFDADAAGQKAADRAVEIFLAEDVDVAIATVPSGKDPADLFAEADGLSHWNGMLAGAADALEYEFERVRQQLDAAGSLTGRQRVAEEFLRRMAGLGLERSGPIRRAMIIQRLANLLHMGQDSVNDSLRRFAAAARRRSENAAPISDTPPPNPSADAAASIDSPEKSSNSALSDVASHPVQPKIALVRAERQLIGCLIREPGLFHTVTLSDGNTLDEALTPSEMITQEGQALYRMLYEPLADGRELTLSGMLAQFAERGLQQLANLATETEAEIEAMLQAGGDLTEKVRAAADAIVGQRRRDQYAQTRQSGHEPAADDDALRQAIEFNRTNRSPLNIMRGS